MDTNSSSVNAALLDEIRRIRMPRRKEPVLYYDFSSIPEENGQEAYLELRADVDGAIERLRAAGAEREARAVEMIVWEGATRREAASAVKMGVDQVGRAMAFLRTELKEYAE